jgi:hypothetical protein
LSIAFSTSNLQLPSKRAAVFTPFGVVSNIGAVSVESSATEVSGMEFSRAKASAVSASKVVSSL